MLSKVPNALYPQARPIGDRASRTGCRVVFHARKPLRDRRIVHGVDGLRDLKRRVPYPDTIAPLAFRAMDDKPCLQRFHELNRRQPLARFPFGDQLKGNKETEQVHVPGRDAHGWSSAFDACEASAPAAQP